MQSVEIRNRYPVRTIERNGHRFDVVEEIDGMSFKLFWDLFASGQWEPATLAMIDRFSGPGVKFYDIGGWVGPTAIWAALQGCEVFTFEPDPYALKALRANIALNEGLARSLTVVPAAAGNSGGDLILHAAQFGISETSLFSTVQRGSQLQTFTNTVSAPMIDIASFIRQQEPQTGRHFIKMDIEGGEFETLPHLADIVKNYDIPLSVSLHPMNIVAADVENTLPLRVAKVFSMLEPFLDCQWYDLGAEGLDKLSKPDTSIAIISNLGRDHHLLITRNPF